MRNNVGKITDNLITVSLTHFIYVWVLFIHFIRYIKKSLRRELVISYLLMTETRQIAVESVNIDFMCQPSPISRNAFCKNR